MNPLPYQNPATGDGKDLRDGLFANDAALKTEIESVESSIPIAVSDLTNDSGFTDDQTGAEIKAAYEAEADTNAYTDAEVTKVANVPADTTTDLAAKSAQSVSAYHINHGATAATARPTGYFVVYWYGTVEPTNAANNDIWIDTTAV